MRTFSTPVIQTLEEQSDQSATNFRRSDARGTLNCPGPDPMVPRLDERGALYRAVTALETRRGARPSPRTLTKRLRTPFQSPTPVSNRSLIRFTPLRVAMSSGEVWLPGVAATGQGIAGSSQPTTSGGAAGRGGTHCFSGTLERHSTDSGPQWLRPRARGLLSKKLDRPRSALRGDNSGGDDLSLRCAESLSTTRWRIHCAHGARSAAPGGYEPPSERARGR